MSLVPFSSSSSLSSSSLIEQNNDLQSVQVPSWKIPSIECLTGTRFDRLDLNKLQNKLSLVATDAKEYLKVIQDWQTRLDQFLQGSQFLYNLTSKTEGLQFPGDSILVENKFDSSNSGTLYNLTFHLQLDWDISFKLEIVEIGNDLGLSINILQLHGLENSILKILIEFCGSLEFIFNNNVVKNNLEIVKKEYRNLETKLQSDLLSYYKNCDKDQTEIIKQNRGLEWIILFLKGILKQFQQTQTKLFSSSCSSSPFTFASKTNITNQHLIRKLWDIYISYSSNKDSLSFKAISSSFSSSSASSTLTISNENEEITLP